MQQQVITKAINKFGNNVQTIKALEELYELNHAICRQLAGEDNIDNIAEEIADVGIMLEQLKIIYDCRELVEGYRVKKLLRLGERVR